MSDEIDDEWLKKWREDNNRKAAESLAAAKAEAARIGKEPFDMAKLLSHRKYDTDYDDPKIYEAMTKDYESRYYSDDKVMNLREMAERLDKAYLYGH